jgi:hypothetical protein
MKTPTKSALTIRPYSLKYKGYDITIPTGSRVSNVTACGNDDSYRFWQDWHKTAKALTGFDNSILAHDLTYYGINVPAEYCEPYTT